MYNKYYQFYAICMHYNINIFELKTINKIFLFKYSIKILSVEF